MKDYKVIQKMNNLLKKERKVSHKTIVEQDEVSIIEYAVSYFSRECEVLSYPAKSYCVAIIYSHLLSLYFGEDFYEVLNDPDLLNSNDDFFRPYDEAKKLYDCILKQIQYSESYQLNLELTQVRSTYDYFLEEFSLENRQI